jgi:hypothetical protein
VSTTSWIVVAVVVVAVAVATFLLVRRARYVRDLRSRGWTFDSSPELAAVLDHQAPPFGLGFERKADELVSGTTGSGLSFRVFEYTCSGGGPRFDRRLASLRLPIALPDLFVSSGGPRTGVEGSQVKLDPGFTAHALDPAYAPAVLSGEALAALITFGDGGRGVDLSVDGNNLVSVGAPKDPDQLHAYLDALAPVAAAVARAGQPYAISPSAARFGFYGRPDWVLVGRDDGLIARYGLATEGQNHRTEQVVHGDNSGLPLDAFVHRWETVRTEVDTDSEGHTQTREVKEYHDEAVLVIVLPFSLPMLSVGGNLGGGHKVRFESEEFNDAYRVRTEDPRFASDVIHPRQMEYLLATKPPGFRIEGSLLRFFPTEHDSLLVGRCADVTHGFLGRIPSFVWKDRSISPPTFRVES